MRRTMCICLLYEFQIHQQVAGPTHAKPPARIIRVFSTRQAAPSRYYPLSGVQTAQQPTASYILLLPLASPQPTTRSYLPPPSFGCVLQGVVVLSLTQSR